MSCGSHQLLHAKPHGGVTLGQLQILPEPKGEHQMLALAGRCGKCQRRRWRGIFIFFLIRWVVVVTRPCGAPHSRHLIHKHGGQAGDVVAGAGRQQERCRGDCERL